MSHRNPWLIAGGCLSLAAAATHLGAIVGGPDWYRFFGAGEGIARAAERGEWMPAVMTSGIAAVLTLWAAYAFAGAGLIRGLPLMRTALVAITAIYLLRGAFLFLPAALFGRNDLTPAFMFWSSLIVLIYGIVHLIGIVSAWPRLSARAL